METPVNITTERLLIRRFAAEDWKDLLDIAVDKANSQYAIYDYPFPTSEKEIKEITRWFASGLQFLAVYEPADRKVIGFISLGGENREEKDLGYTFHSAYWGKGYAAEACRAVLNYAFYGPDIERLTSGTANLNTPSIKLLLSLGFVKTGEQHVSLNKTPEGNSIEFTGSSFLLDKAEWLKKHETKT